MMPSALLSLADLDPGSQMQLRLAAVFSTAYPIFLAGLLSC
jgi:hypothetical protein